MHAFKHGITLDVTYNMMLGEQRRRIHRAVGEWYEQSRDLDPGSLLPLLAHHWDRADDDAKAIEYLEKASAVTLDEGAYQEAAQLLRRVLERDAGLAQEQGELVDDLRRARWNRQLADVHLGLGETEECSRRVRTSLELAAHPLPDSRGAWKKSLVLQILIQTSHLLTARSRRAPVPDEHKLEAARAATVLAERAYYESDALAMATASLLAVNLAEKVGEFALVARSYALMGLFAGLSRLHPLARRYFQRARTVARETEDYRGLSVAGSSKATTTCASESSAPPASSTTPPSRRPAPSAVGKSARCSKPRWRQPTTTRAGSATAWIAGRDSWKWARNRRVPSCGCTA